MGTGNEPRPRTNGRTLMNAEWLTYAELAARLGTTTEAARQRAIRGRWQRQSGNDGKARVLFDPEQRTPERTPSERPNEQLPERTAEQPLIAAMQAHIETLKVAVTTAEQATERERERAEKERARVEDLSAEVLRLVAAEMVAKNMATDLQREIDALRSRSWWRRLVG